jgi:membrane-associated phospholipid phosphatase
MTARSTRDPFDGIDGNDFMVFVPAIMSVGLVFTIVTLIRDLLRRSSSRSRRRRSRLEAGSAVGMVLGLERPRPRDVGILSRPAYLASAIVLVGAAAYVSIGSVANFLHDGGPVRDIGWLLAISLALSVVLGFLGAVALSVYRTWPHPPPWTLAPLRTAPLTTMPGTEGRGPSWAVSGGLILASVTFLILTLMVGTGRSVAMEIDRPIALWLTEIEWLDRLDLVDPFGLTAISIGFVLLIGAAGFRCRVTALVYPAAFVASWGLTELIQNRIGRPRPDEIIGDLRSFPSGHMVQAVFIAGLVPLAIDVLIGDRRITKLARVILAAGVVLTGLDRIHESMHWPLDALAGAALGLTIVLAAHWMVGHASWHQSCSSCPWSGRAVNPGWDRALVDLTPRSAQRLRRLGIVSALTVSAVLIAGTWLVGLPTDPEGYGFGSEVSGPVQLTLAALVAIGAAVAFRWPIHAAGLIAFCATGLGLFASIQYSMPLTVLLAGIVLAPAVMLWLGWQAHETLGTIASVAVVTATLLSTVAVGSSGIADHYFGPTHPESLLAENEPQEAEWLWLGGVTSSSATVTAGALDPGRRYTLYATSAAGPISPSTEVADDFGVARFVLDGLEASTTIDYAVRPASDAPTGFEADASFRTIPASVDGLVVVFGSCARVGTNGAVFERMLRDDPDLFIALGDLHYSNLASDDPRDHLDAYERFLDEPAPAALMRSIPTAYVWDDHDYGPNDGDASSPSREAVGTAYRAAVPNYGVPAGPTEPIQQAFTVSDIRFVLVDGRSQRTSSSMLGVTQQEWLVDEIISSSRSHRLVVWINPSPWIAPASPGGDDWGAHADDRSAISQRLAEAGVDNLIMVSGDAHMVAIDDGSNSGYADDPSWGFPVLHAAALDRPGSVKGGPYSEGAVPGGGQYGRMDVSETDDGQLEVVLSGRSWNGETLIELELEFD